VNEAVCPGLPWVDVATGSLRQGLPIGVGVALAGKRLDKLPYRVWVLCGDGEMAEGSIWEAAEQASFSQPDNLTVIVDVNRLGQRGPTRHGWNTADLPGVSYLRTCRGEMPVIYQQREPFEVGGSRVLRSSPDDEVTLVAAGVTVHEALAAADLLADDGICARVIDAYSVKPIDVLTLRAAARETGRIVTVEDHYPEGGLGDAVLSALAAGGGPLPAVRKLAVRAMPGSATPDEQLQLAGIDMASIATAAAELVGADPD
jgi:transketolase C-terminal domain/subunit